MRRALLMLLCWVYGSAAHAQSDEEDTLSKARARGSLEIAVYADFPPFSYKDSDGAPVGVDVDLANALAQKLGLRARLRFMTAGEEVGDDLRNHVWKGHYLGGGVADVMLHVPADSGFAREHKQVRIFGGYFHESVVIAHRAQRAVALDTPLSLAKYKIGVELDTLSDLYLSSIYSGRLRASVVRKWSLRDAVGALHANEVDAVMGPKGELEGLLALTQLNDARYKEPALSGLFNGAWDIGMAVKKEAGESLQLALTQAMQELRNDGELAAIFRAHHITYAAPGPTSSLTSTFAD